jgi:hypothetical protein
MKSNSNSYVFETIFKSFGSDVPEYHVVFVDFPKKKNVNFKNGPINIYKIRI